jgi:nitrogen fixation protein NifB
MHTLNACRRLDVNKPRAGKVSPRPCVAVASMEGVLVNQHLGEADSCSSMAKKMAVLSCWKPALPRPEGGACSAGKPWPKPLSDCSTLLVSGVGANPQKVLTGAGIEVLEIEGLIDEALRRYLPARA